jgi:DNA-binding response OmpR family regulator
MYSREEILILDDQACLKIELSEELAPQGYRVTKEGDTTEARAQVESLRPNLVLLDLYLDGPEGWEVLRDVKSPPACSDL